MRRARIAVVGIGNTIAGDDGVGVVVAERLAAKWQESPEVTVTTLPGDLFAVSDLLDRAEKFLFLDAIAGDDRGQIRILTSAERAFAPSFHQTDIGTVMQSLKALKVTDPFPDWQVWGITIDRPHELGEGLSPEIAKAAEMLEGKIVEYVEALLKS